MKLHEILLESITFNACTLEYSDQYPKGIISPHNMREEDVDCPICGGAGHNEYPTDETRTKFEKEECGMCRGTGKHKTEVCDGPQVRLSNMNAGDVIRDMLGQEFDYAGMVEKKDMPKLRQKLIRMINVEKDRERMSRDPSDEQETRVTKKNGISTIGKGPRMIGFGRNDSETKELASQMLKIIEYAAKHNLVLSWG